MALVSLSTPVLADPSGSILKFARGQVTAGDKAVKTGDALPLGSEIHTGADSVAIVTGADGAVVLKLDSNSAVKLTETGKTVEANLTLGGAIADVQSALAKSGRHFQVRTRTAVMGVRGTQFYTALHSHKAPEPDVWMCVKHGVVEVTDVASGKVVPVKEGLGVLLPAGGKITEPKPYGWTKDLNWNMEPASGDVSNTKVNMNSAYSDPLLQNYD